MPEHESSKYITFSERPTLRNPILITAFAGWNDAAEGATAALEFLLDTWEPPRFATLDPEEFYDFTETRPTVKLVQGEHRRIDWPANDFFYYIDPERSRDIVLLSGVEPALKWRTFAQAMLSVAQATGVTTLVSLGALLADVSHSRPSRVSVSATDKALRKRLEPFGSRGSKYEGPTGIISVVQDTCRRAGIPSASLWGHAPHYLSASPNPQVTLGMLRSLAHLLDLTLDLRELEEEAEGFVAQVNEAVAHDPEATSYIHMLEAQEDEDGDDERDDDAESYRRPSRGSSGGGLIQDVEDYLRRRRGDDE